MIKYKEIEYKNYGKCLEINNGHLELIVTLDIGPRVISFRRLSGENVFFEDINRLVDNKSPEMDMFFGKGATWYGLGGHRIWRAPEDYSTYYPEADKVTYEVKDDTLTFTQVVQPYNNVQLSFSFKFIDEYKIEFNGNVENKSEKEIEASAWSLSMCKGPGLEIVKLPKDERSYSPQSQYTFWGFGAKINDPRAFYGNDYFALRMVPGTQEAYKVGLRVKPGKVMYLTGKEAIVKTFVRDDDLRYPDNNVNYETYTKDLFLELEVLSPLKTLKKNESVNVKEVWELLELKDSIPTDLSDEILAELYNKYAGKF